MNIKKFISIIFILSLFAFCRNDIKNSSNFGEKNHLKELGSPEKLEYYQRIKDSLSYYSDSLIFAIWNKEKLNSAIEEISYANHPEPWKGAGWNKIKIYYPDTLVVLFTDNNKIGTSSSGQFYYLKKDNFILENLN